MQKQTEILKERARSLRASQTPAEAKLWAAVRDRRLGGIKFGRQVVVGAFVVDFIVRSAKLAIELDGATHAGRNEYDARRTAFLEQQGYRVIRFTNGEVMGNLEGVLTRIGVALADAPFPNAGPSPRRGEGVTS